MEIDRASVKNRSAWVSFVQTTVCDNRIISWPQNRFHILSSQIILIEHPRSMFESGFQTRVKANEKKVTFVNENFHES